MAFLNNMQFYPMCQNLLHLRLYLSRGLTFTIRLFNYPTWREKVTRLNWICH